MRDKLPAAFIDKYTTLLGDESEAFLASFDESVEKAYRINPLKANNQLAQTPDNGRVPYGQWGHLGAVSGRSIDHVSGLVYSQEPSAQLVGEVLAPNPGETVLDLAAAPGGKTTHLAAFMQQKGLLWANEIFMNRAKILSENVERMGVQNAIVTSHAPAELSAQLPGFFDKILLDAPCSGEGMFRKDPAAIQYWHEHYPAENAARQREILAEAVKMLKPGGQIVYSTCTFAPEEDEKIIAWLLQAYPEINVVAIDKPADWHVSDGRPEWSGAPVEIATEMTKTARLWPHRLHGEGHFVAKLVKTDNIDGDDGRVKPLDAKALSKEQQSLLTDFLATTLPNLDVTGKQWVLFGERLYLAPVGAPDIKAFKILRLGLEVGEFKKKRFEPAHALALAVHPNEFVQSYELADEAQWAAFMHGDVLRVDTNLAKGWVVITANGNGVGWAKYVDGQLKNFLPKGLRFAASLKENLTDDMY
ncbi:MAG TPA: RsmF rRNA methyltransferase first C-terminal domain-containing protein [Lactobacillaceae bacterium]|jgi:NOL1/NOP2/sun family putative RNA methylase